MTQVLLRRLCVLALIAGFVSSTAQSADLHVHAAPAPGHDHGLAAHHHDDALTMPADDTRVAGADDDHHAILVRLNAAPPASLKPVIAPTRAALRFTPEPPTIVSAAPVVARAHGPPSARPTSLRAPPFALPA